MGRLLRWVGAMAVLAWLGLRPMRVQVIGDSMTPTLREGDRAISLRALWVAPGDLVVIADPQMPGRRLVKRALWIGRPAGGPRMVWVEGDNPAESTDSRSFGLLGRSEVRGVAVWVYHPQERSGLCWRIGWPGNATPRRPVLPYLTTGSAGNR